MADYSPIAQALDIRLSLLTGLPSIVQYDNMTIDLPDTELSLEANLIPSETIFRTLGIDSKGKESGVYQITVVSKTDVGKGDAYEMADKIRNHFNRGLNLTKSSIVVRIERATIHPGKSVLSKYKVPISIYYLCYS